MPNDEYGLLTSLSSHMRYWDVRLEQNHLNHFNSRVGSPPLLHWGVSHTRRVRNLAAGCVRRGGLLRLEGIYRV